MPAPADPATASAITYGAIGAGVFLFVAVWGVYDSVKKAGIAKTDKAEAERQELYDAIKLNADQSHKRINKLEDERADLMYKLGVADGKAEVVEKIVLAKLT